jgi:glyoxylase-like metal-dependent hydrolase (beta-lactamase superfamily II)
MKIHVIQSGECRVPENLLDCHSGMRRVTVPVYSLAAHHPSAGLILIDTGHTSRFTAVTKQLPGCTYRWITQLQSGPHQPVAKQLEGLTPTHIVLSHLHADHVAGLSDFPSCPIWGLRELLSVVERWKKTCIGSLKKGYLPELLPHGFRPRFRSVTPHPLTWKYRRHFPAGRDLFNDGRITIIPLPGHASGHSGVMLSGTNAGDVLYISDAVWSIKALTGNQTPSSVAMRLNEAIPYKQTMQTLKNFMKEFPDVIVLPAHCDTSGSQLRHKLSTNRAE